MRTVFTTTKIEVGLENIDESFAENDRETTEIGTNKWMDTLHMYIDLSTIFCKWPGILGGGGKPF